MTVMLVVIVGIRWIGSFRCQKIGSCFLNFKALISLTSLFAVICIAQKDPVCNMMVDRKKAQRI